MEYSIEVGKSYYFIAHAYHHFLGEVVKILGPNRVVLKNVSRIQSCRRGWTEFFRDGVGTDTVYTIWPDGHEISNWISVSPWKHKLPGVSK